MKRLNQTKRILVMTAVLAMILTCMLFAACGNNDTPDGEQSNTDDPAVTDSITVSIAVDCNTLLDVDPELAAKVSSDGIMLDSKSLTLDKGSVLYDALKASGLPIAGGDYISSINGLSAGDAGAMSGWICSINGEFPTKSVKEQEIADGDLIEFRYTCDGGSDVTGDIDMS
jgi:hypothetical protein